jgi:hypothetical protein
MVIDLDETRLHTTEQSQEPLRATPEVAFTAPGLGSAADNQRCEHISRVAQHPPLKRNRAPAAPIAYLLQRADTVHGDARYERLADLSVVHLHDLRKRAG